jgi:hypothetical protein
MIFPTYIKSSYILDLVQKCGLCNKIKLEGNVSDCSCDFDSVNSAVNNFFTPLLKDLTTRCFI